MVLPIILIMLIPPPFSTIGALGSNIFMLWYIRRFYKGMATGLFGKKAILVCSVCDGAKFDGKGTCKRCGNKSRRLG